MAGKQATKRSRSAGGRCAGQPKRASRSELLRKRFFPAAMPRALAQAMQLMPSVREPESATRSGRRSRCPGRTTTAIAEPGARHQQLRRARVGDLQRSLLAAPLTMPAMPTGAASGPTRKLLNAGADRAGSARPSTSLRALRPCIGSRMCPNDMAKTAKKPLPGLQGPPCGQAGLDQTASVLRGA